MNDWLQINRGSAPLIVAMPHTGTTIPADIAAGLADPWRARRDTDWWIDRVYDFAAGLGATTVRTLVSRTVIDVNRDPSGASLYPGQATTALCPTTDFDGEPFYRGPVPDAAEIGRRRRRWFEPYHAALAAEIGRLRRGHAHVVVYDAHAIRSRIPRLFDGELPHLNIGTNDGTTCAPRLAATIAAIAADSGFSHVVNGRFKGGWTTRHYGRPNDSVHAVQMELACRSYMNEPANATPGTWPPDYDATTAAPLRTTLIAILRACLAFATQPQGPCA